MGGFLRSLIAPVIAAFLAAGVANAAFWQWSKTAATNATADPSINWAEGMSPSSVNDSARAMMAALANWRYDVSGSIATGGTSTAYTLTTNSAYTPSVGTVVSFFAHAANGATPTLNVDGSGAKPIQTRAGEAVPIGAIALNAPYTVLYCTSCNGGSGSWILTGYYENQFNIPLGGMVIFSGTTSPNSNFVFANGQCISRTTYAAYFAMVSTTYGACDGVSTFGVPDLRERMMAFQGTMGGAASPARITSAGGGCDGTILGNGCGAQNRTVAQANLPSVTLTTTIAAGQGLHNHGAINSTASFLVFTGAAGTSGVSGGVNEAATPLTDNAVLPQMTGTTPLGGSGTALQTLPPLITLTVLVRVF